MGETKNSILMRMSAHRYALRGYRTKDTMGHILENTESSTSGCRLEYYPNWEKVDRL